MGDIKKRRSRTKSDSPKKCRGASRYSKIVFVLVFILINILVLVCNTESSLAQMAIYNLDVADGAEIDLSLVTTDGEEYIISGISENCSVNYAIPMEYHDVSSLSFCVSGDPSDFSDAVLVLSSRNKVLYKSGVQWEGTEDFTIAGKQTKVLCFFLNFDWRVKLQIYSIIWAVALVVAVIIFLKRRKLLNVKFVFSLFFTFLLLWALYQASGLEDTYTNEDEDISADTVTGLITDTSDIIQEIHTDSNFLGFGVRFATYATEVTSDYTFLLQDTEGNVLETVVIPAAEIQDNQYTQIMLENCYEAGTYFFTIQTSAPVENTVSIWMSNEDDYADGDLFIDADEQDGDLDFYLLISGPNLQFYTAVISTLLYIVTMLVIWKSQWGITTSYVLAVILAGFIMLFYWHYISLTVYDEVAQISYIANIAADWEFVPSYETQYILVPYDTVLSTTSINIIGSGQTAGIYAAKFGDTVNYLGHPPLYYWIMAALHSVEITGDLVCVNYDILRIANICITMLGILIFLYAGYSRIPKDHPELHFLYAAVISSMPLISGIGASINNDNLSFLISAVFLLAMLRFAEGKRDILTYLLIAASITASGLTKVTVFIMIVICSLVVVVGTICRERSGKCLINRNFLMTLPVYLIVVIFYLALYAEFGTFFISLSKLVSEERMQQYTMVYMEEYARSTMSFPAFLLYFFRNFFSQWINGVSWNGAGSLKSLSSFISFPFMMLWISPVVGLLAGKLRNAKAWYYRSFSVALLITVLMQFIRAVNDLFYNSGHAGLQSRYYVCMAPVMLLILCDVVCCVMDQNPVLAVETGKRTEKLTVNLTSVIRMLMILLGITAVYGGILIYMFHCTNFTFS